MNKVMTYVAFTAGAVFILIALAILFTNLIPDYVPTQFKVMMGIVLFLYGIFRIVLTIFKRRNSNEELS